MKSMRPMEAVAALYAEGNEAREVFEGLSRSVFGDHGLSPSGPARRLLARLSYRVVKRTTRRAPPGAETAFRCPILERSGHAYARSLLSPSRQDMAGLVEGGDPMNGPYMMILPEVRRCGDRWDGIFFNSVQGRDVQLRFIWETLATHAEATRRLEAGRPVSLKGVAAGTGLSLLLVCDRLLRDGHDPSRISASITDREASNTTKTRRLAAKIPSLKDRLSESPRDGTIAVHSEDAFSATGRPGGYDVVTAIGILEYLQGETCDTTAHRLGRTAPASTEAASLATVLAGVSAPDGSLIVNTYRPHSSVRLLEVFGKEFAYRTRENMAALLGPAGFRLASLVGSGNIYDVEIYSRAS